MNFLDALTRFNYDPATGKLTWREHKHKNRVGKSAGCLSDDGYYRVTVKFVDTDGETKKRSLLVHRLAWLLTYGCYPPADKRIDHEDESKSNNKIANLRAVSCTVNNLNVSKARKTNKLGMAGVKQYGTNSGFMYAASITLQGKAQHIGVYLTAAEAQQAYMDEKALLIAELNEL